LKIYKDIFREDVDKTLICAEFGNSWLGNTTQQPIYRDLKVEFSDCTIESASTCELQWKREVWRESHVLKAFAIHEKLDFNDESLWNKRPIKADLMEFGTFQLLSSQLVQLYTGAFFNAVEVMENMWFNVDLAKVEHSFYNIPKSG